jgi:hypothetical protein
MPNIFWYFKLEAKNPRLGILSTKRLKHNPSYRKLKDKIATNK